MTSHSKVMSLGVLLFIVIVSLFVALLFGSMSFSASQIFDILFSSAPSVAHDIIWKLRLPRAFAAFVCGGLLAMSGVLLQVLLRNPLADPYVLGVSGGAALGALVAMLFGASGAALLHLGALAGAFAAIAIVFALSFRAGDWNVHRLLLTGIVLSAGFTALISLVLVLAPQVQLRGMLFWLMGDLSFAPFSPAALCLLLIIGGFAIAGARTLNVLARGEIESQALGVALSPARIALFGATAALTATAVITAGGIGFIGLVTPHLVRLIAGSNHRIVVPASILLGGTLLTLADTLARIAAAPRQLPVGALTALIGVPLFLMLMRRERRITS